MSLPITDILNELVSHADGLGRFERVNEHEPKNAPGSGITAAIWLDRMRPVTSSGLASTSALLVFNVRLYAALLNVSDDLIDPQMLAAVDELCAAYSGDFTLGGLVRHVDLLGVEASAALEAVAGYLSTGGNEFRVITITLPLIVNDLWEQVA